MNKSVLDKTLYLMKVERECVAYTDCNRNCSRCSLAQEQADLLEAYDVVLDILRGMKENEL